ncbi:hypothetical protein FH972_025455 [Carpinus fangiana]|uniref:Uncharacterized protein n=1 Tax=Carpinus fangiana TaxID=176857 RepID=A0A5N6L1P7_9ROSI|nr:hypothetical protein FH972_025455 [Carpinus fangiana]
MSKPSQTVQFPKGRVDSLTTHILKRCSAISSSDRQTAVNWLNDKPAQPTKQKISTSLADSAQLTLALQNDFQSGHNMSALETLAEVSRRRLNSSELDSQGLSPARKRKRDSFPKSQEDGEQSVRNDVVEKQTGQAMISDLALNGRTSAQTTEELLQGIEDFNNAYINEEYTSAPATGSSHRQHLITRASNETGLTEETMLEQAPMSSLEVQSGINMSTGAYGIDPQLQTASYDSRGSTTSLAGISIQGNHTSTSRMPQRPKAHAPYLHQFSATPGVNQPKLRSRFSDARREQVREIRNQGACVRCRMLKKPCSDETPCDSCKTVVSSRLWRQPCIRKRLRNEFDLYSAGVHNVLLFHESNRVKTTTQATDSYEHIEVTHSQDSSTPPTIVKCVTRILNDKADTIMHAPDERAVLTGQLSSYIKLASHALVEHESSTFMRETLKVAHSLVFQKHDPLLEIATELWTATHILVDPRASWNLTLVSKTTMPSSSLSGMGTLESKVSGDAEFASLPPVTRTQITKEGNQAASYAHILVHLRASIEFICTSSAGHIVTELERRLLQRNQASNLNFQTFLTAIILLNCVEKMCWLFEGWVEAEGPLNSSVLEEEVQRAPDEQLPPRKAGPAANRGAWCLDRPPTEFVAKGDSIADTLSMLLHVRKVPPRTVIDDDGILRAVKRGAGLQPSDEGDAIESQGGMRTFSVTSTVDGDIDAVVAQWLDSVCVRKVDVEMQEESARREAWDGEDCRAWEMKYMGRLLLPDR